MAGDDDLKLKVNEFPPLLCPVCADDYLPSKKTKIPIELGKCGHIFCRACAAKIAQNENAEARCCPLCRALLEEKKFEDFKECVSMMQALAVLEPKRKEGKTGLCDNCESKTTTFCSDCNAQPPLCKDCFTQSHRAKWKKGHALHSLDKKTNFLCDKHQDEKLKLFCFEDHALVCV